MKFDRSLMKTFLRYVFDHKTFATKGVELATDFNTTGVKLSDFIKGYSESDIDTIKTIVYLLQHANYINVNNEGSGETVITGFTEKGIDLLLKEIL